MNYAEVILKYFDLFRLAVLLPIKSQFLTLPLYHDSHICVLVNSWYRLRISFKTKAEF